MKMADVTERLYYEILLYRIQYIYYVDIHYFYCSAEFFVLENKNDFFLNLKLLTLRKKLLL